MAKGGGSVLNGRTIILYWRYNSCSRYNRICWEVDEITKCDTIEVRHISPSIGCSYPVLAAAYYMSGQLAFERLEEVATSHVCL